MNRYAWAGWGDINAFFGLMLDNVSVMLILVATLSGGPKESAFTAEFVLTHMIPGTALGVFLGDLVYTWMAFRLARRTGNTRVTAMPLGLDTPSTFGVAFLVLLPALHEGIREHHLDHEAAMTYAWHVGAIALILMGVFKTLFAPLGNKVRRIVPRAGLLGSLAAIALALIATLPLVNEIAAVPLVGMVSLTIILVTLVAHQPLPGRIPGALAAVLLGVILYQLGLALEPVLGPLVPHHEATSLNAHGTAVLLPVLDWKSACVSALAKLPVVLPFALATVIGGLDCTESAAAAGDEYDTRTILLTEGLASMAAGVFGGVIQNTPYIGQPAYKAMGGRAAYTLATALFIGAAGYFGWVTHMFDWLPQAALFPILLFVGLEITAQSFRATPQRHYPALALAILPALAALAYILVNTALGGAAPSARGAGVVQTLRSLNNGFIVTSLLWGAALAALLDHHRLSAAAYLAVAGACAFFGIIHSPLADQPIAFPWDVMTRIPHEAPRALVQTPYHWAAAYGLAALVLVVLSRAPGATLPKDEGEVVED